jgi:hypothetical protein
MGAHIARLPEAVRLVNGGAECQRGQWADAGHCHKPAARGLGLYLVEHPLGEPLHFLGHYLDQGQERLSQACQHRLVGRRLAHPRREVLAARRANLQPDLAQQRADAVLDVAALVEHHAPGRQQRAPGSAGRAFHVHRAIPAGAQDLGEPASIVAVRFVPAGVGLEMAGVALDARGFIKVDEHLQTTAPGIWGLGESAGSPMFTHVSMDDYRVAKSGITGGTRSTAGRLIPYCVFIDPEFARVGLSEWEAHDAGIAYRLATLPIAMIPRAQTLAERKGFMKALVGDDGHILGFAMLGAQAGEVMTSVQMAMLGGLDFTALRDGIIAHPTLAEGLNLLFSNIPP